MLCTVLVFLSGKRRRGSCIFKGRSPNLRKSVSVMDTIQQGSSIKVSTVANRITPHLAWKWPSDKAKSNFQKAAKIFVDSRIKNVHGPHNATGGTWKWTPSAHNSSFTSCSSQSNSCIYIAKYLPHIHTHTVFAHNTYYFFL